jgi:glyoxylase-like metal-dependent hydrolase (beta-lactamase superfamily II)
MAVIGALVLMATVVFILGGHLWWLNHSTPKSTTRRSVPPVGPIYQIAPKLYVVPEGGGNTAVFVTASGVVLVDTKYPVNWQALLAQVKTVTDKPITHVINTHAHPDHTGGNLYLPDGVQVIVQANTAANMERLKGIVDFPGDHRPPMRTYTDRMTLLSGEDAIDLYYFGPAHTNGDTFVVFRSAGVMHAGDVFSRKAAPMVYMGFGGGAMYADTLDKAVAEIRGVQQVISGHGPVFTWSDFLEFREFYRLLLEHVRAGIKTGKDKNSVFLELKLPPRFSAYNLDRVSNTMDEIFWSIAPWHRRLLAHIQSWL